RDEGSLSDALFFVFLLAWLNARLARDWLA
ncbi:hypothetical protein A2U01_0051273, partial [Trifolium medium]|nr:hypothetical protein [Trifolium medium]